MLSFDEIQNATKYITPKEWCWGCAAFTNKLYYVNGITFCWIAYYCDSCISRRNKKSFILLSEQEKFVLRILNVDI